VKPGNKREVQRVDSWGGKEERVGPFRKNRNLEKMKVVKEKGVLWTHNCG